MKQHTPLLRRMAAAAAAAMLLTLAACAAPADGATAPRQEPVVTVPRESVATEPAKTHPTEPQTQPTEATEPTQAPTEEVNPEQLVSDAYRYIEKDDYGYEYCYHIPRINLNSCATINESIYKSLFHIYYYDVEAAIAEYGEPEISGMSYIWNYTGGIVSILVIIPSNYADWTDHLIYYVSAETGERLEMTDLLAAYGIREQEFRDQVYAALDAYWDNILASWSEQDNAALLELSQDLIDQTLSDENIQAAVPFISADGDLSFLASVFVPAGGGEIRGRFDFDTGAQLHLYDCPVDHSSPVNP